MQNTHKKDIVVKFQKSWEKETILKSSKEEGKKQVMYQSWAIISGPANPTVWRTAFHIPLHGSKVGRHFWNMNFLSYVVTVSKARLSQQVKVTREHGNLVRWAKSRVAPKHQADLGTQTCKTQTLRLKHIF